jgi:hypothetical protein
MIKSEAKKQDVDEDDLDLRISLVKEYLEVSSI